MVPPAVTRLIAFWIVAGGALCVPLLCRCHRARRTGWSPPLEPDRQSRARPPARTRAAVSDTSADLLRRDWGPPTPAQECAFFGANYPLCRSESMRPFVDPPAEQRRLVVGPLAVAGHGSPGDRAVDAFGVFADVGRGPQVE